MVLNIMDENLGGSLPEPLTANDDQLLPECRCPGFPA